MLMAARKDCINSFLLKPTNITSSPHGTNVLFLLDVYKRQTVSCAEIAVEDLARAVNNNSRELVIIKGEIAVKEITKLQEELSKKRMKDQ